LSTPEKDPRVYFAAERTFLAWIRTGLALMGFGFVVARFGLFLRELRAGVGAADLVQPLRGGSLWAGTALVLLGVIVQVISTTRYLRLIRDFNEGRVFTGEPSRAGIVLALLLALIGIAIAAYLLLVR
jgi:putative membrane protein